MAEEEKCKNAACRWRRKGTNVLAKRAFAIIAVIVTPIANVAARTKSRNNLFSRVKFFIYEYRKDC